MSNSTGRKSNFKRNKVEDFSLKDVEIDILKTVYRYRFVSTQHLLAITPFNHVQSLNLSLRKLYDAKYLDRPINQVLEWRQGKGQKPMVYGLGNKGAEFLNSEFGWYVPEAGYQTEKNRRVKPLFIQHTLEVADVMIAIEKQCRDSDRLRFIPLDVIIATSPEGIQRRKFYSKWPTEVYWNGTRKTVNIIPDYIFGIEFLDKSEGKNKAYFFLEADRGTMPLTRKDINSTSILRKFLSYEDTYLNNLQTKYFNIKKFRVLTVTTSKDRVANMIEVCAQTMKKTPVGLMLFTDVESLRDANPFNVGWMDVGGGQKPLVN